MAWYKVGDISERQNERGDALTYGDFGRDTYGLTTVVDDKAVTLCIRCEVGDDAQAEADKILEKLASGWRPVNW